MDRSDLKTIFMSEPEEKRVVVWERRQYRPVLFHRSRPYSPSHTSTLS
jgi:hypothetical protein